MPLTHTIVAPHTPRMGVEERAPDFVRALSESQKEMGAAIRATKPDVLIINSAHWVCTFNWHVTCQAEHVGHCVADEAPDLIDGVPYRYRGDPEMGRAILAGFEADEIPCAPNESTHFQWDYGSWVPSKHLDPDAQLAIILIGTVTSSDVDECMKAGTAIRRAVEKLDRRAVFAASCAFTHELVRGPASWPTEERQKLDGKFIEMLTSGRIAEAKSWFKEYNAAVVGEMGGRTLATFLGCLDEASTRPYTGKQYGPYTQSSGSGNANIALWQA
ncbi:MAG: hypothetical protein QGG24_01465 [Vicinamibacterales bacterium]|jgi:3,4-dihydroxyphenylacetate 2,3-dioxygenase|nr:hypothetical protein [Acidobacteriota bacterium]MDP7293965.1 hypothetical protein [Vicinamibacterales bacterium]MDP7471010.1 hypothetical protein [Vicinamibacterales bacterium]MDP7671315.1 hypothetical protein [Vicinamibacterales bacterium]HJO38541.1 hypothetical protein [Vicinamibacterales bacterium]|tara:strand:- start:509 stop:1327 length:819 start_codon:yes stop_codon:yes gene_type:complete